MGIAGPSREILAFAAAQGHPVLFTGHLPADSPGERMVAAGQAAWLRLPTHPTLSENVAIAARQRRRDRHRAFVRRATLARLAAPHCAAARRCRDRRSARDLRRKTMRILVANDDGIAAPGLLQLAEAARALDGEMWIVAPGRKWTAASHQLSFDQDLRSRASASARMPVRAHRPIASSPR